MCCGAKALASDYIEPAEWLRSSRFTGAPRETAWAYGMGRPFVSDDRARSRRQSVDASESGPPPMAPATKFLISVLAMLGAAAVIGGFR